MKSNPFISTTEHKFLVIVASLIFFLTILNIGFIIYEDSFKSNAIDFSYCGALRTNFIHYFRFLSLLIFIFLLIETKRIFTFLTTFLSFSAFAYENYYCFNRYFESEWKLSFFEIIEMIATPLDYFVFLIVSALLIWQISILWRSSLQIQKLKIQLR